MVSIPTSNSKKTAPSCARKKISLDTGKLLSTYATDKVDIADVNYNINNNQPYSASLSMTGYNTYDSPMSHWRKDKYNNPDMSKPNIGGAYEIQNVTYFPSKTITYESIGTGSTTTDENDAWSAEDSIISVDLQQEATIQKIGEENALKIGLKVAPSDLNPQDNHRIKSIIIELRNLRKRYINPALRVHFAVYNDNVTPAVKLSKTYSFSTTDSDTLINDSIDIRFKSDDKTVITYGEVRKSYLKVWAEYNDCAA